MLKGHSKNYTNKMKALLSIILVISFIKPGFSCNATASGASGCSQCSPNGSCRQGSPILCACNTGLAGDGFFCYNESTCLTAACCPYGYNWNQNCCVPATNCLPACAQDEICTLSGSGWICKCNLNLYYGGSDLTTQLDCTLKMKISISKCQAEALGYDPSTMRLIDAQNCTAVEEIVGSQRRVSIEFDQNAGQCGTTNQVGAGYVIFNNTMFISPLQQGVVIVGEKDATFSCSYPLSLQLSLSLGLSPVQPNITSTSLVVSGTSTMTVQMALFKDSTFLNKYASGAPIALPLETPLYVSVMSPDANGAIFALVLKTCYATPSSNPNDPTNYTIIENKCPIAGIPGLTVISNGASLESRFKVNLFKFVRFNSVYLFCNVQLCDKRNTSCVPTCGKAVPSGNDNSPTMTVNSDRIELQGGTQVSSSSRGTIDSPSVWRVFALLVLLILSMK